MSIHENITKCSNERHDYDKYLIVIKKLETIIVNGYIAKMYLMKSKPPSYPSSPKKKKSGYNTGR